MRFLKTLCVAALFAPTYASANELDRLYGLALENDAVFQAAQGARDALLEEKPAARGALLPQISASGSYGKQTGDATTESTVTSGPTAGTTVKTTRAIDTTTQDYSAKLTQVLFDLAAWRRLQKADDNVALAQANYRNAEQSLVVRLATAYFNLLAADDAVRSSNAEKSALERQLELAKKRFEVGLSAVTDVQEAQARYDLVTATSIVAQQTLASARIAVGDIAGVADVRIVPLKDEIPLAGPVPADLNAWLKAADEGNLTLRAAEIAASLADRDVGIAQSGHLPTLGASATYDNNKSGGAFGPQETNSTQYGVGITIPIFAGGTTQARVNQAQAVYKQRAAELSGAKRRAQSDTQIAYQNVLAGAATVKARKQAVLSSQTALEASSVGLEVGSRTTVDVLNAQQQLYAAQRDYSRSRYDYLIAVLNLKAATGQVMAKDVNEIDALLGVEAAPPAK